MSMPPLSSFNYVGSRPASRAPSRPITPAGGTIPASALFPDGDEKSSSTAVTTPSTVKAPSAPSSGSKPPQTSMSLPQASTLANVYKPSKVVDSDFNFAVPTLPPRLANFGRKISQMGSDFMNEIDAPYSGPTEGQGKVYREEVPGMGDEPVMCPFCEKPLPPALFAAHTHPPRPNRLSNRPSSAGPGTLKRSNTITGARPTPTPLKSLASMKESTPAPPKLLDPLPVAPPDPVIRSDSLQGDVSTGETANAAAAALTITDEDLKRWSKIAGIAPPVETPTPKTEKKEEKEIPKIAPPPPGGKAEANRTDSSTSKTFGFFGKKDKRPNNDDEGDESDDGVGGTGYSRLQAGGSDTEDEDQEGHLHEEPEHITPAGTGTTEETKVDKEDTSKIEEKSPDLSSEELKKVLGEIVNKMTEISKSHTALLTSQGTLLTSLKIAQSNLAMAEANTEMLEAQIKTTPKPPATAPAMRTGNGPMTPGSNPRAVPASAGATGSRHSEEYQRPASLQMPSGSAGTSHGHEKSGWGFWNNNGNKRRFPGGISLPSASSIVDALPTTPSIEGRNFEVQGSAPLNGVRSPDANRVSSDNLHRSASFTGFPMSPPRQSSLPPSIFQDAPHPALEQLQKNYESAQNKMQSMTKELAELKKGKLDMEAELENLSQALFEEANKMVADERRKRTDLEESLKEVKEEREALRQTIKVLGGQTEGSDDGKSEATVDLAKAEDDSVPPDFMPRDLDKHYEALRKSIHHVADGASDEFLALRSNKSMADVQESIPETVQEETATGEEAESGSEHEAAREVVSPTDDNPWANPSPFTGGGAAASSVSLPGEDKLKAQPEIDPHTVSHEENWTS